MFIHGFAVVESNDDIESKLESFCRNNPSEHIDLDAFSHKTVSEYIFTELFNFILEYTYINPVSGNVKYLYTINVDDWYVYWSFFMNRFYSAGVSCVGGFQSDGGPSIWFDVQGVTGVKGWLNQVTSLDDINRWNEMLTAEDKALLAIQGFRIENIYTNK